MKERELDAWLAEHVFGYQWVAGDEYVGTDEWEVFRWLRSPSNTESILGLSIRWGAKGSEKLAIGWDGGIPRYQNRDFKRIKREIERRGWNWAVEKRTTAALDFLFQIWKEEIGDPLSSPEMKVTILARIFAKTEGLAGCLAMKAAVEKMQK